MMIAATRDDSTTHEDGMFWLRPDLDRTALGGAGWLDTALFDIDGVLIDTTGSYRRSVIAATDALVRITGGFSDAPEPLVTPDDVEHFKLAGGFNSDWDLTQALVALWTARLREWRGTPLAERALAEWADDAASATRAGAGSLTWLRRVAPASAIPDWDDARWTHDEFYWGAAMLRDLHGRAPRYTPDAPGLRQFERLLLTPETLTSLAALGLEKYGLITGRVSPEVEWALRMLAPDGEAAAVVGAHGPEAHPPFGVIVPASLYTKPDPLALAHALRMLDARAAIYAGDTSDDLDLVLRYRAERLGDGAPSTLAVSVASGAAVETFRQRGADITISSVSELPDALIALRERLA
ncbi:MAG TPA: HAD family hydrolase [Ktedonobacterales bacterium]|nr:HAD family hydrolase [Ktedonobacterales bacterium]